MTRRSTDYTDDATAAHAGNADISDGKSQIDAGEPSDGVLTTICSYCHSVAWPPGAAKEQRRWIITEEYYRLGGRSTVPFSHGICPTCYETATGRDPA